MKKLLLLISISLFLLSCSVSKTKKSQITVVEVYPEEIIDSVIVDPGYDSFDGVFTPSPNIIVSDVLQSSMDLPEVKPIQANDNKTKTKKYKVTTIQITAKGSDTVVIQDGIEIRNADVKITTVDSSFSDPVAEKKSSKINISNKDGLLNLNLDTENPWVFVISLILIIIGIFIFLYFRKKNKDDNATIQ